MQSSGIEIKRADKAFFAVYQTVYSGADIEMWYDWKARLNDTAWTDDCFFLWERGEKIGGVVLYDGVIMYPFLVEPFCDKRRFWQAILGHVRKACEGEIRLRGMPQAHAEVLMSFGARFWRPRQIMCRPTDAMPYALQAGYRIDTPTEQDIPELAKVQALSYRGGIATEMFGEDSLEEIVQGLTDAFCQYRETGSMEQTVVVRRRESRKIVGACVSGITPEMIHGFSFINELYVHPEHRGRGLAEALLRHSISVAHRMTPVVKLHVLAENPAVHLYRKLGFTSGPQFIDMKYKV